MLLSSCRFRTANHVVRLVLVVFCMTSYLHSAAGCIDCWEKSPFVVIKLMFSSTGFGLLMGRRLRSSDMRINPVGFMWVPWQSSNNTLNMISEIHFLYNHRLPTLADDFKPRQSWICVIPTLYDLNRYYFTLNRGCNQTVRQLLCKLKVRWIVY